MTNEWLEKYQLKKNAVISESLEKELYAELAKTLEQYGISPSEYALNCPDAGGVGAKLCLHRESCLWAVYTSERGERFSPAFFASPWDASNYLIWNLVSTSSAYRDFPRFKFDVMKWR